MDECLAALRALRRLATLAVTVASFVLDDRHMAALGALPLADLRLVSQARLNLCLPRVWLRRCVPGPPCISICSALRQLVGCGSRARETCVRKYS